MVAMVWLSLRLDFSRCRVQEGNLGNRLFIAAARFKCAKESVSEFARTSIALPMESRCKACRVTSAGQRFCQAKREKIRVKDIVGFYVGRESV